MATPNEGTPPWELEPEAPKSETPPWELPAPAVAKASTDETPPWELPDPRENHAASRASFMDSFLAPNPDELTPINQGSLDRVVNKVIEGGSPVFNAGITLLEQPAHIIAGLSERGGSAASALVKTQSLGEAVDSFLSPPAIQKLRNSMPDWDVIKDQPLSEMTANGMSKAYQELAPNIRFSDTVNPGVKDFLLKYPLAIPNAIFPDKFNRAALDFGMNLGADPLNYIGIGQATKAAKAAMAASKEAKVAQTLDEMIDTYKAVKLPQKTGLAASIERGEKSLLSIGNMEIKGQKIAEKYEDLKTSVEAGLSNPFRPYQMDSGLGDFDTMIRGVDPLQRAADAEDVLRVRSDLASLGPISENASRYAAAMGQHGAETANKIMKAQGVKLTPDDFAQAQSIRQWQEANFKPLIEELSRIPGGADFVDMVQKVPTLEEQAKILKDMSKQYGRDIPRIVVDGTDITFGGAGGVYTPRSLNEATKEARKLEGSLGKWDKASNFGSKSSAELPRSALSTEAMNVLLGEKFGVKEAFNTNYPEVVMKKYAEVKQRISDLKLIDWTKTQYGTRSPKDVIEAAAEKVKAAQAAGRAPDLKDLRLSKMTPKDFRTLDDSIWNKWGATQSKGKTPVLMEQKLLYPKAIADRLESKFMKPSAEGSSAFFSWYQNQWAKNRLSDPFRLGMQSFENGSKMLSLLPKGFKASALMDESRMMITGERDAIGALMDKIPVINETPVNLKDFGGADEVTNTKGLLSFLLREKNKPIVVTPEMIADPETQKGVWQWLEAFHGSLKDGKTVEQMMPSIGSVAKNTASGAVDATKKTIEFMNNNPVSRASRAFANSADVITKRAYMRSLLEGGMNEVEATMQVGNDLMDFGSTTEKLRDLRKFSPFASFQAKNLETLFPLLAAKPGVANIFNPYDGHLKRLIQDSNGWDPETTKQLQKRFPLLQDKALGSFLRGQPSLLANPDVTDQLLHDYVKWGIGEGVEDVIKAGTFLSFRIPSTFGTASEFINPLRLNENIGSPMMAAILVGMSGIDPYTGQKLQAEGTKMQGLDRITKVLQKANPIEYKRLMNLGINKFLGERSDAFRNKLAEGPISREMAKMFSITLGADAPLGKAKLTKEAVASLTHPKFAGLASMNDVDWTYFNHQMALVRSMDKTKLLLRAKAGKEGRAEALRALDAMIETAKDINSNAKAYMDYRARAAAAGAQMDALTEEDQNLLHRSMEMPQSIIEELQAEGGQAIDEGMPLPNQ